MIPTSNRLIFLHSLASYGTACSRFLFVALVATVAACSSEKPEPHAVLQPDFVGSQSCESCHQAEFDQWQGSHHQLAMQATNAAAVLGDFSGVTIPYFDTSAAFTQREGRYYVTTDGANGEQEEFEITHTFGVTPLQQYLVDAPGGRKQALQYAWDSRPEVDGGQRWYHLYPDEHIGPGDPLHWTGRYFNWNYMCAECHSTNVQLGYNIDTDSFDTSYSEVTVGCEACHGPGSRHVEQAGVNEFDETWGLAVNLDDRHGASWVMNLKTGIAERSSPNESRQQPEACGRCHARRGTISANYEYGLPLADTHMISLLDENLYYADGRIQDEVYVYGSFVQSKMYAAGVTCSDCHDPHSGKLRAGPNPNDTCATCHLSTTFATEDHSANNAGDCVSCHMQDNTYMGVDDRRDHSFRLPDTYTDPDHYGAVIAAGRAGGANNVLLAGVLNTAYPPIARATMLSLLEPVSNPADVSVLRQQLDDPDPLVRIGALRALRSQAPEIRIGYGSHLLRDPIRSVRIEAALTYVEYHDLLPLDDARAFASAADDFRHSMRITAAMPDAALSLAEFEARLGDNNAASRMYEHALRIGTDSASVQHAYGLHLVREGVPAEALIHLRKAAHLAPEMPQFAYVYGVALNSLGQPDEALKVLADAWKQFPDHFDIGWALATVSRDQGDYDTARMLAKQLVDRFPDREQAKQLLSTLEN